MTRTCMYNNHKFNILFVKTICESTIDLRLQMITVIPFSNDLVYCHKFVLISTQLIINYPLLTFPHDFRLVLTMCDCQIRVKVTVCGKAIGE